MNILLLCNQSPFPPREGAPLAMNAVACGLQQLGHEVSVITFCTKKQNIENEDVPLPFKNRFFAIPLRQNAGTIRWLTHPFSKKTLKMQRFFDDEFSVKLEQVLQENTFDVIQLESIYMACYIPLIRRYSEAKIVLRAHNVEHLIWERVAELTKNPVKQIFFSATARKIKRFELATFSQVDAIVTFTPFDFDRFRMLGFTKSMLTLPFGIDIGKLHYDDFGSPNPLVFCHIGEMGKKTNLSGIRWFLNNVWNLIHIQYPHVKFYIAGRNIPFWMQTKYRKRDDVVIVGEVMNASDFIRAGNVLIVPILQSGGMSIKIIEGMACMRPVITTHVGSEGIRCENKKNILIANTSAQFFDAIEQFIHHPEHAEVIGRAAQQLIKEKYNNKELIFSLLKFYEEVLNR